MKIGDRVIVKGSPYVCDGALGMITRDPDSEMPGIEFDGLGFLWISRANIKIIDCPQPLDIKKDEEDEEEILLL